METTIQEKQIKVSERKGTPKELNMINPVQTKCSSGRRKASENKGTPKEIPLHSPLLEVQGWLKRCSGGYMLNPVQTKCCSGRRKNNQVNPCIERSEISKIKVQTIKIHTKIQK